MPDIRRQYKSPTFPTQVGRLLELKATPNPGANANADSNKPALICFSDRKYDGWDIAQFKRSPDFKVCHTQYMALLDGLVKFAQDNATKLKPPLSPEQTAAIQADFSELKDHLSGDHFDHHAAQMYGVGKEWFHELAQLLDNPKIDLQKRVNAVSGMADKMRMCSGGVLTELQSAISGLKSTQAGLRGASHKLIEQMAEQLILQHVQKKHQPYCSGNEVHFVNAYFNYIAPALGFSARVDKFTGIVEPQIKSEQLEQCQRAVLQKLKPEWLARQLAEDYMDTIKSTQPGQMVGRLKGDKLTKASKNISNLQEAELHPKYGEFLIGDVLKPADDEGMAYKLVTAELLAATKMLPKLKEEKIVDYNDVLTLHSDANGTINMLGNLCWREHEGDYHDVHAQDIIKIEPNVLLQNLANEKISPQDGGRVLLDLLMQLNRDAVKNENEGGHLHEAINPWLRDCLDLLYPTKPSQQPLAQTDAFAAAMGERIIGLKSADTSGATPFMLACRYGSADIVRHFLDKEPQLLEDQNVSGKTALSRTAFEGRVDVLEALMGAGANINHQDKIDMTPLMHAACMGHVDAMSYLLKHDADVKKLDKDGWTALTYAAASGKVAVLNALIAANASTDHKDQWGMTPLMHAAKRGHVDAVKCLLHHRPDLLEMSDKNGCTALAHAATYDEVKVLNALIAANASINHQDKFGQTPLMHAVEQGHVAAVKCLLQHHPNLELSDEDGETTLTMAAANGKVEVLNALIENNATISPRAMWLATGQNHVDAVRCLLKHCPHFLELSDDNGWTLLTYATHDCTVETLEALIKAGANINHQTNEEGKTPLMWSVKNGRIEAVKHLIDVGARLDLADQEGQTVFDMDTSPKIRDLLFKAAKNQASKNLPWSYWRQRWNRRLNIST